MLCCAVQHHVGSDMVHLERVKAAIKLTARPTKFLHVSAS